MTQAGSIDSLTPREREILSLIAEGHSLFEISKKLNRSQKTIESHRLAIGRKLDASNRVELAHIAIASGLVKIEGGSPLASSTGEGMSASDELAALEEINSALTHLSGHDYIKTLCQTVCRVMKMRYCAVCVAAYEEAEDQRFAIAISDTGQSLPSYYYSLSNSPVADALEEGAFCIADGLAEAYAGEPFFADNDLRSYFAVRLDGDFGAETGVLAVVDDKPFAHPTSVERIMRFFIDRISAELTLLHQSEEINKLKEQIKRSA